MAKKKADLIEEAKALGLEVSEKMTIAEISEAIKGYKAEEIAEEIVEAIEVAEAIEEVAEEKFAKSGKRSKKHAEEVLAKEEKEARKKQKSFEMKEIRVTPNTDTHGFEFKAKNARKFLEDGNKLKITVRFRGREMNYKSQGEELLNKFVEALADIANTEKRPIMEGKNMFIILTKKS